MRRWIDVRGSERKGHKSGITKQEGIVIIHGPVMICSIMSQIVDHRIVAARQCNSPNCNARPSGEISLIVIHGISLPVGHFTNNFVERLFLNALDVTIHPDFADLAGVCVSSHLLIRRDGALCQFVAFDQRAWHAGTSQFEGRDNCNDFSIGIELEGTDTSAYRDAQYWTLARVCKLLVRDYALDPQHIVGHSDIAPGRKTDPGPAFNWARFRTLLGGHQSDAGTLLEMPFT